MVKEMRLPISLLVVLGMLSFVSFILPSISMAIPLKDAIAIISWVIVFAIVGWGFRW